MASSGTYAFAFPFDDVIAESWERVGKNPAVLTGNVAGSAIRSLQLLATEWTNNGLPLWQIQTLTATLAKGVDAWTLPENVVDVLDAYVTLNGSDRILSRVSRGQYAAMPRKLLTGYPSLFWLDRQVPASQIHFYLVPDADYQATFHVLRMPQDVGAMMNTPDAPLLFADALAAGLAARLAEKYAPERLAEKQALADRAFALARGENRERVALSIVPKWGF